jgi:predicted RNase H-like HicB family nuclease
LNKSIGVGKNKAGFMSPPTVHQGFRQSLVPGGVETGGEKGQDMLKQFKVVVEKHADGYVAYPVGMKGHFIGEGPTYEEALSEVKSAILFHIKTFGEEVVEMDSPVLDAFVTDAGISL